ncbi:MAG: glycosyltransferase [Patescibacteria group bacterium]
MKIAIIHDFLTKIGGAEKVLALVSARFPDAPIYTLLYDPLGIKNLFKHNPRIIASSLNRRHYLLPGSKKLFLARYPQAVEEFDLSGYDLVLSFSNSFAHGVLTKPQTPHICYCYSPMRFVWDWHNEYLRENKIGFGPRGLIVRSILHKVRIWDRLAADRVDYWLTQSETARARIKKYYNADALVINPPVDLARIVPATGEPESFYLVVSRLEPYKQVDLAVRAFNGTGRQLVVIGEGSDRGRLTRMADKNISFLGYQSDDLVINYMKRSYALVFPGEEDFGLTPVESMAAGRPVVAYGRGGVTETVVAGKTGLFFDRPSVESLRETLDRLEQDYRLFEPSQCRQRAEQFSSEIFVRKLSTFIDKVINEKN